MVAMPIKDHIDADYFSVKGLYYAVLKIRFDNFLLMHKYSKYITKLKANKQTRGKNLSVVRTKIDFLAPRLAHTLPSLHLKCFHFGVGRILEEKKIQ